MAIDSLQPAQSVTGLPQQVWHRVLSGVRLKTMSLMDRCSDAHDGIETAKWCPTKNTAHPYFTSPRETLRATIANVPGDREKMTFVDFGSGKGRALFAAARAGFGHVVGVEFAEDLHQRAVEKRESFRATALRQRINLVCVDAAEFEIPTTDCVLNFYNPFGDETFRAVLNRVAKSHREVGSKIFISHQQMRDEPGGATPNLRTLREAPFLKPRTVAFRSARSRFLLASYVIEMFETV